MHPLGVCKGNVEIRKQLLKLLKYNNLFCLGYHLTSLTIFMAEIPDADHDQNVISSSFALGCRSTTFYVMHTVGLPGTYKTQENMSYVMEKIMYGGILYMLKIMNLNMDSLVKLPKERTPLFFQL